MARYTASIETPRPPAETFAYLSDFSTTKKWDPGVVEAERLGDAPIGEGMESVWWPTSSAARPRSRTGSSSSRRARPSRCGARTRPSSRSTGSPSSRPTGTRVTCDADLALKGPLRVADPVLGLAFDRIGDRALEGLREALGGRDPARLPPLSQP